MKNPTKESVANLLRTNLDTIDRFLHYMNPIVNLWIPHILQDLILDEDHDNLKIIAAILDNLEINLHSPHNPDDPLEFVVTIETLSNVVNNVFGKYDPMHLKKGGDRETFKVYHNKLYFLKYLRDFTHQEFNRGDKMDWVDFIEAPFLWACYNDVKPFVTSFIGSPLHIEALMFDRLVVSRGIEATISGGSQNVFEFLKSHFNFFLNLY